MKVLLLCDYRWSHAPTITDHINSLLRYSENSVYRYSGLVENNGDLPDWLNLDVFDAVIVHYSIFVAVEHYLSDKSKARLAQYQGVKAVFLQDEYRFVNKSIEGINTVGADIIFTCVPEKGIPQVYPPEQVGGAKAVNVLTGYVSDALKNIPPKELGERKYDVSYRGRKYPAWHGRLGREKWEIAKQFKKKTRWKGLKTNISYREKDRVHGANWVELIRNSRSVLGVESGASVFDFTGEISTSVETISYLLGEKRFDYDQVREDYFADLEDKIGLEQISPRVFEAISLRTLCILYEGDYSGVVKANEHYLPLKKDFSNIDEVCKKLKDDYYVAEIVKNAYVELVHSEKYSNQSFVKLFDAELSAAQAKKVLAGGTKRKGLGGRVIAELEKSNPPMMQFPYSYAPSRAAGMVARARSVLPQGLNIKLKNLVRGNG